MKLQACSVASGVQFVHSRLARIVVLWEVCALVWVLYCVGVEAVLS